MAMQIHENAMPSRRGRPPTGIRKEVVQVPLDPGDAETLGGAADALGRSKADVARALIKGEMSWADVAKAARKGRR
jgi:hypothetical protein